MMTGAGRHHININNTNFNAMVTDDERYIRDVDGRHYYFRASWKGHCLQEIINQYLLTYQDKAIIVVDQCAGAAELI